MNNEKAFNGAYLFATILMWIFLLCVVITIATQLFLYFKTTN